MAQQTDPVEQILIQFGKLRGEIQNQINRIPAPEPIHRALVDMDRSLSKIEDEMVSTALKASPLNNLPHFLVGPRLPSVEAWRIVTAGPKAWAKALEQKFGR